LAYKDETLNRLYEEKRGAMKRRKLICGRRKERTGKDKERSEKGKVNCPVTFQVISSPMYRLRSLHPAIVSDHPAVWVYQSDRDCPMSSVCRGDP